MYFATNGNESCIARASSSILSEKGDSLLTGDMVTSLSTPRGSFSAITVGTSLIVINSELLFRLAIQLLITIAEVIPSLTYAISVFALIGPH